MRYTLLVLAVVVCSAVEDRRTHHHSKKHEEGTGVRVQVRPPHPGVQDKGDRPHHQRGHSRRHGAHKNGRKSLMTSILPEWAEPWLKGSVDLGPAFNMDWDLAKFFNKENKEWWKGPNVCVTRDEKEDLEDSQDGAYITTHHFSTASSCDETETSYKCTTVVKFYNRRKTFTVTYECCHGYQREAGLSGCPKVLHLTDVVDTARELGTHEYVRTLESMGLDQMLNQDNYTIFAPKDSAFKIYKPKESIMEMNVVIISPEMRTIAENTRELLLSHVAGDMLRTSRMQDEQLIETVNSKAHIRINLYDVPKRLITANCIPLLSTDNQATNGVVHLVDGVLKPIQDSLSDLVSKNPHLSILKTMIGKMGLVQTLKGAGQYTLFAPTDAAFKKLKPSLLEKLLEGNMCLNNLVRNHLLPNVICSSVIEGRVRTRNVLSSYVQLTRTQDDKLFVSDAQIVATDLMATNGVLHMIDEVLVPDDALDVLDVAEKAGATEFLRLIQTAGLSKTIQNMANFTLFMPTNQAIEALPTDVRESFTSDPIELVRLLKYHIATSGVKSFNQMHSGMKLDTLDSDHKVLIKEYFSAPFGMKQQQTAQCAPIVKKDYDSCNGVAHLIDKVLVPPKGDVLDTLSRSSNFSHLVELLKVAELAETLQKEGPFTFFAPTNQAFQEVDADILNDLKKDKEKLKGFIKYHIMRGTMCCEGVFDTHWFWKQREWTLEGSIMRLGRRHGNVQVDRQATVDRCDMTASNGVVHSINIVLPEAWKKYTRGLVIHHEEEKKEEPKEVEEDPGNKSPEQEETDDDRRHKRIHKFFDENWDRAWERMRDWDWLDSGWKWDDRRRKRSVLGGI